MLAICESLRGNADRKFTNVSTRENERKAVSMDDITWSERRAGKTKNRDGAEPRPAQSRDRARVIHSSGFRRLQGKTQVLGIGEGDFHRTRLTHSMEVAQISRGIVWSLKERQNFKALPSLDLIETIALSHDLGHPPFGHGGEIALNCVMCKSGGFEGNGQTLRLLSRLEAHTKDFGLDLCRRTLLGILKYPVPYEAVARKHWPDSGPLQPHLVKSEWKPPKCYLGTEQDVVDWILQPFSNEDREKFVSLAEQPNTTKNGKPKFHSLDTGIMELGDDIAYGVHDFEDGIALRLIDREDFWEIKAAIDPTWASKSGLGTAERLSADLFESEGHLRKRAIGGLVHALIVSVKVKDTSEFADPLLNFQPYLPGEASALLKSLKAVVKRKVIDIPQVQTLEFRGQHMIRELFGAFVTDPTRLLKENFRNRVLEVAGDDDATARVVCDYVAGMTDDYATRMYERLFVPGRGSYSDQL